MSARLAHDLASLDPAHDDRAHPITTVIAALLTTQRALSKIRLDLANRASNVAELEATLASAIDALTPPAPTPQTRLLPHADVWFDLTDHDTGAVLSRHETLNAALAAGKRVASEAYCTGRQIATRVVLLPKSPDAAAEVR